MLPRLVRNLMDTTYLSRTGADSLTCGENTQDSSGARMKVTDDRNAKVRLWATNPTVAPFPAGPILPKFQPKKFRTHAEMNLWKEAFLLQIARERAAHG